MPVFRAEVLALTYLHSDFDLDFQNYWLSLHL